MIVLLIRYLQRVIKQILQLIPSRLLTGLTSSTHQHNVNHRAFINTYPGPSHSSNSDGITLLKQGTDNKRKSPFIDKKVNKSIKTQWRKALFMKHVFEQVFKFLFNQCIYMCILENKSWPGSVWGDYGNGKFGFDFSFRHIL